MKTKLMIQSVLELLLMMALYAVLDNVGGIVKYIVVISISCLYLFFGRKNKWSREVLLCIALPAVVYLIIGSLGAMVSGNMYTSTIKTVVFWLLPLLFAFSIYVFKEKNITKTGNENPYTTNHAAAGIVSPYGDFPSCSSCFL